MDPRLISGYVTLAVSTCATVFYLIQTKNTDKENSLMPATMVLIFLTLLVMSLSWVLLINKENEKKGKKNDELTLSKFMDFNNLSMISVVVGMIQGFVFGTIDNFGMALGISGLESTLNSFKLSAGMIAGISNLYSSIFGSAMGAVLEKAIKSYSGVNNTPWWGNLFGIIFGSLFGLKISEFVQK